MDCKLLILVPALVILLIVLYNRKVSNRYILALGLFIILLLNEILKNSEHFQNTNGNKEAISLIDEALLNKDLTSTDKMLANYEHEMDVLEANVNPIYNKYREETECKPGEVDTIPLTCTPSLANTTLAASGTGQVGTHTDTPSVVGSEWTGKINDILDRIRAWSSSNSS